MMIYNKIRYPFNLKLKSRYKGTAIMETAVGLLVLVPVFLLLLDVIALVIGQTINDDLAKSACKAASVVLSSTPGQPPSQSDGLAAANAYLDTTIYRGSGGLVSEVTIPDSQFIWDTTSNPSYPTVTVGTQIVVNLPVPVPLGGPKSQVMNAQSSLEILTISPTTPPTASGS